LNDSPALTGTPTAPTATVGTNTTQIATTSFVKAQTLYTNQTITANKTVTIAEFVNNNELVLRVSAAAGNVTITLPTFTSLQGYKVTVRKVDSSANSVTITGVGAINIDGAATLVVSGQYGKATIGADLVQYIIL
jgi:riboflavin transporter FmnP